MGSKIVLDVDRPHEFDGLYVLIWNKNENPILQRILEEERKNAGVDENIEIKLYLLDPREPECPDLRMISADVFTNKNGYDIYVCPRAMKLGFRRVIKEAIRMAENPIYSFVNEWYVWANEKLKKLL